MQCHLEEEDMYNASMIRAQSENMALYIHITIPPLQSAQAVIGVLVEIVLHQGSVALLHGRLETVHNLCAACNFSGVISGFI